MSERGPEREDKLENYVDWERLEEDPTFQTHLFANLVHMIVQRRYPDFKARFLKWLENARAGEYSMDEIDREQRAFDRRLSAERSIASLRELCRRENLPFPEGEDFIRAQEQALEDYWRFELAAILREGEGGKPN